MSVGVVFGFEGSGLSRNMAMSSWKISAFRELRSCIPWSASYLIAEACLQLL